jgi:hypothetical protein
MRHPLAILATAALSLTLAACASNSGASSQNSVNTSTVFAGVAPNRAGDHDTDRDNDGDHNDDDLHMLGFGYEAGPADYRASVTLLKAYYAAAASENGAKACTLLAPFLAESVAEHVGDSPALRGKTCAVVMSKLFATTHKLLVEENATLQIQAIRVGGDRALAAIYFPSIPEVRQMAERRIDGGWKLLTLLDTLIE